MLTSLTCVGYTKQIKTQVSNIYKIIKRSLQQAADVLLVSEIGENVVLFGVWNVGPA